MSGHTSTWRRLLFSRISAAAVILAAVAAAGYFLIGAGGDTDIAYKFTKVARGPIESAVSASGSVRPVVTVQVGSQVSGQIAELFADFNSAVGAGDVIARLDPALFEAKVWQGKAELQVAKANVGMQNATLGALEAEVEGARAAALDAKRELDRKKQLLARKVVATSVVDTAAAERDQADAKLRAAQAKVRNQQAQLTHAKALVEEKRAGLRQRELDLEHSIIRSPVDGVVISRDIDVGQTVAASLQAPTLFTIAQDLRRMQVEVSVDEADIGQLVEGQRATFTVDSFADREFEGRITQIRKAPTEISNVVTYTVVVSADNDDQSLLPGMTANVSIIVSARDNALKIENAALRFRPTETATASASGGSDGKGGSKRLERVMRYLTQELRLTDAQQRDIRAVYGEIGKRARAMKAAGASREEIREVVAKMREDSRKRVALLLDDKQRQTYLAIVEAKKRRTARAARVWVVNDFGIPRPIRITTGITDGTATEIVRGDLREGQAVIVGQAKAPRDKESRWRLGF